MLKKIKTIIAVAVLSGTVSANAEAATVTVQKGDTLSELSQVHNTSIENIQKLNHLTSDVIHPGDVLNIVQKKYYKVKKGDTLSEIARDYHVSVSQIKKWNKLKTDKIQLGRNLLILDGQNTTNKAVTKKPMKQAKPKVAVQSPVPTKANSTPKLMAKPQKKTTSRQITVKATAYTASCAGCTGITKMGINIKANPNAKVIAVDPSVIPLGSKVYVEGFGKATAADIGGAIKGNRIDVFIPSKKRAIHFGVKKLKVTILN